MNPKRTCARCGNLRYPSVAPPLKPLADALAATTSSAATLEWLEKPHIRELLTRLAAGTLPLTHEALDAWPRRRAVVYLRDLLTDCGILPPLTSSSATSRPGWTAAWRPWPVTRTCGC